MRCLLQIATIQLVFANNGMMEVYVIIVYLYLKNAIWTVSAA